MNISNLNEDQLLAAMKDIMAAARDHGLVGWGGDCWSTAAAMNKALFGAECTYVAAVNRPLSEAAIFIGHVAIKVPANPSCGRLYDMLFDADGTPKSLEEIEAWGMLDPDDTDWQEMAYDNGIDWDDNSPFDAEIIFPDESTLARFGSPKRIEELTNIIEECANSLQINLPEKTSQSPSI